MASQQRETTTFISLYGGSTLDGISYQFIYIFISTEREIDFISLYSKDT